MRLHRLQSNHVGIIVCTEDSDFERLAASMSAAISRKETLLGKLIRINRPQK
jgi:hypothetical protein